jgi:predicted transglutaminase-like cysteine proteinase
LLTFAAALTVGVSAVVQAGMTDLPGELLAWAEGRFGPEAPKRLLVWQRLVAETRPMVASRPQDPALPLARTNDFFNQVPYALDMNHWGMEDYWATPPELLGSFGGDCEDYSIAKYLTLKDLGVPISMLRIMYVRALNLNESHMVLLYYPRPDAEPLVLDNLVGEIQLASERTDLEPVYSFNDDDLWLPSGFTRKGGSAQVRQWKDMLQRLDRQTGAHH